MMTLLKKYLALLLAVALCLSLTACGGSDDDTEGDDGTVGNDWRNSGEVAGRGTITHEGEGSVDVLIIVSEHSAAFYKDQPKQVLYDSVSFPITILDALESLNEISLEDLDGDGETDVYVSFIHDSGDITQMVWIWVPGEGYVFREDLSILPTFDSDDDISEYVGLWEYVDENLWLRIYEDETWEFLNDQEDVIACGTLWVDESGITLYFDGTDDVMQLDRAVSGDLLDAENNGVLVPADSIPFNNSGDISEYVGLWEYVDENLWLRIYEDETWEFLNDQEDVIAFGTLWVDESGITLYFDGTDDVMQLDRAVSGDLLDGENNGVLVPADSIQSRVPYFTRYGLEINAEMDNGIYLMEDGFGSFSGGDQFHSKGEGYTPGDCYWEVIKYYDDTYDGIREIKFDAICYVPYSSLGDIDEDYKCSIRHQLYDFYTGKWFTRIDEYKTSTRGKDYYVHTVDWNGQSGIIEFTRSHDWQRDVGEWTTVMTASYHIYMPEWYDGLVLATEPLPDNYEDFARFDSQHRAFAEASIMDIDLLDPYGCLFFSVCD
ncbi:MAG: hypothetical protein SOY32_04625 [Candidatus Faecousia sp.]|nr:hypothetical protein [Candidatus Faecousia sp.]